MRNFALASLAALAVTACATPSVVAQSGDRTVADELKAFPAATAGQKRHVLTVPAIENEDDFKVQLLIGQTQTVDCNIRTLGGTLETRTAEGWGYDYYVVPQIGPGISTLMGCTPNTEREDFVTLSDRPLVRYNSRLPIVVYTPENVEVRYRIWRAGEVRGLD
ncbi:MAG: serine protease inhibitor ecotin [Janthinobacterium lividum]